MVEEITTNVTLTVTENNTSASLTVDDVVTPDSYSGTYEVEPTTATQTLATAGKVMKSNVVVDPIPSNYGLITWDGSVMTVS